MIEPKDRVNLDEIREDLNTVTKYLEGMDLKILVYLCAYLIVVFVPYSWTELYSELRKHFKNQLNNKRG